MGMPGDGAIGLISISDGHINQISGMAVTFVTAYRQSNPNESDQAVYDYFSNWSDGNTFTAKNLLTGDEVKQFLGF